MTRLAAPLSTTMPGCMSRENCISGHATHLLTSSGRDSASALGASSPSTMCKKVMMANAVTMAAPLWTAADDASTPARRRPASTSDASAGSPTQPSASDANVMPSWVPEMYRSRLASACSTSRARRSPAAAHCAIFERRDATKANSAATKNALASTRTSTTTKRVEMLPAVRGDSVRDASRVRPEQPMRVGLPWRRNIRPRQIALTP
jgi:hypothetical protein